jgi:glycosyltransferase involved in cell wall biosynthesis
MNPLPPLAELDVLLTPRATGGGHEKALLGWLGDAVRDDGLRPRIIGPTGALAEAVHEAGLADWLDTGAAAATPGQAVRAVAAGPRTRPLLLAPGVLHHQAWLTAAAVALRRNTWLYVPMTYSARRMGFRAAMPRDALLAAWLRRVRGFITISEAQSAELRRTWQVPGTVLSLPNRVRLGGLAPPPPAPAPDGLLRVGYVGRFDLHQKGLDWLAATLRADGQRAAQLRWHLQGRGAGAPTLHALAAALGPQRVQVHGFAPLEHALARVDVLLLPSRFEGLPLVALEATAHGWPVVASRQAGLQELLPAHSMFEFGDAAGMWSALATMATPWRRQAAVAHARTRLRQQLPDRRYDLARAGVVRALRAAAAER